MSLLLAKAGYQVTGVDLSEEMLTVAYDKAVALEDNRPFFVRQSMQRLRLPEPVDWVLCCLDSINYLTDPAACRETFRRVYRALKPGGVFLFDVNTPEKLREMDGQVFLDEDDDVFCVWRGSYEETERICTYGMDLFQRQGASGAEARRSTGSTPIPWMSCGNSCRRRDSPRSGCLQTAARSLPSRRAAGLLDGDSGGNDACMIILYGPSRQTAFGRRRPSALRSWSAGARRFRAPRPRPQRP